MLSFNDFTFPALAWSLLAFMGLVYLIIWRQTKTDVLTGLYFLLGLLLSALLIASPLHQIGKTELFFVRMFEYMMQIYLLGALLLQGIPAIWLEKLWLIPQGHQILKWTSGLLISSIGFNLIFFGLHIPVIYNSILQIAWLDQLVFVALLPLGVLMWLPLFSRAPVLRLSISQQMFYLILLILEQVPVFVVLTFSNESLYPTYLMSAHQLGLSAVEDQHSGGWLLKMLSTLIFAAAFIQLFINWSQQQRRQDQIQNQSDYENMALAKQAKPRKG